MTQEKQPYVIGEVNGRDFITLEPCDLASAIRHALILEDASTTGVVGVWDSFENLVRVVTSDLIFVPSPISVGEIYFDDLLQK